MGNSTPMMILRLYLNKVQHLNSLNLKLLVTKYDYLFHEYKLNNNIKQSKICMYVHINIWQFFHMTNS